MAERFNTKERRKELLKAINEWRSIRKVKDVISNEFMEDGKGVIHVNVEELYNPMSVGNFRQLNSDIFDYIEYAANLLPSMMPLRITFHGVKEEDRENVPYLFKLHYELDMQDLFWDKRTTGIKMLYMTLIGVMFVVLALALTFAGKGDLFREIFGIFGSYCLCEAAGCYFVERRQINRDLLEAARFQTAELVFEDGKDDDRQC